MLVMVSIAAMRNIVNCVSEIVERCRGAFAFARVPSLAAAAPF